MKRTYYTAVIAATLLLGSIYSTAPAGNKHFSSAGRSMSFNRGGSANNSKPNLTMTGASRIKTQAFGGNGNQFQSQAIKRVQSSVHPPEPVRTGGHPPNPIRIGGSSLQSIQSNGQLTLQNGQSNLRRSLTPSTISNNSALQSIVGPTTAACIKPACVPDPCKPCDPCKPKCGPCFPWPWPSCYPNNCYPCDPCCKPIYIPCPTYCDPVYHTVVVSQPTTQVVVKEVEKLMQVPVGSTLVLQAQNLGTNAGQVMLQVDKVGLGTLVNEWKNESVNTTLPMLGIAGPTPAQIVIFKADGSIANSLNVELIPAQPQAAAAVATNNAVQVAK